MTLAEFMKKRREDLGLTWNDIIDGGIANNTWCNIVNGKQLTVKPATMEKLARVLKCTIGDLQACMAETPNPLRKEAEKPEGQAGASITAKKVMVKKNTVEPEPEPEPEVDIMFPVEEPAEEPEETLEEFKARMKDRCLYEFSVCGNLEEAKILIAEAVLKELLGA